MICERHDWVTQFNEQQIAYVAGCRKCGIIGVSPNSEREAMQIAGYKALKEWHEAS